MTASVGFSIFGSSRVSTRMSRGAWSTAPRMVIPLVGSCWCRPSGQGDRSVAGEDLLGDGHRRERLRPAGVERQVCDRFDQLVFGGAVVLRVLQVKGELLGVPAGNQSRDRDEAAVAWRELRALPHLAEHNVVGEVHECWREVAEHSFGARRFTVCGGVGHCCPSKVGSGFLRLEPKAPRSGPSRDALPYPGAAAIASVGRVQCARRTGSSKRDHCGDQQTDLPPVLERALVAQTAPNPAPASAPPTWRLVLNTPLAVPARWPGTLLSSRPVTGGITSGPPSPTKTISTASSHSGVAAGTTASATRPTAITTSPATTNGRTPRRSASRALNGVSTRLVSIIGRKTTPVPSDDRPRCCCSSRLITNGSP